MVVSPGAEQVRWGVCESRKVLVDSVRTEFLKIFKNCKNCCKHFIGNHTWRVLEG